MGNGTGRSGRWRHGALDAHKGTNNNSELIYNKRDGRLTPIQGKHQVRRMHHSELTLLYTHMWT